MDTAALGRRRSSISSGELRASLAQQKAKSKSWMISQRNIVSTSTTYSNSLLVDDVEGVVEAAGWDAVRQRLRADPGSARVKGVRGWLPLHAAASGKAPLDVVKTLLRAHADGATARDESGHMPIHYAAAKKASAEVIKTLAVATFPPNGMPPSVLEAARCNLMPELLALLARNPKGAQETDDDYERLPLVFAVRHGASTEVIEALLKAYKKGTSKVDKEKKLPIHHAARKSHKAIKVLLAADQLSATKKDLRGRLPIHYCVKSCHSPEVVELLLTAFPASAREADTEDGMLPLHWACGGGTSLRGGATKKREVSLEVVKLLLRAFPGAVRQKDSDSGRLALHHAVFSIKSTKETRTAPDDGYAYTKAEFLAYHGGTHEWEAAEGTRKLEENDTLTEVVKELLKTYADGDKEKDSTGGAKEKDSTGSLALHLATRNNPPLALVSALLGAYEGAAKIPDGKFTQLPLHHAVRKKASLAVVQELLRVFPEGAERKTKDGLLPLHHATRKAKKNKEALNVVKELLASYPDGAQVPDTADGNLPLHNAIRKEAPPEVIEEVLKAYEDAVEVEDMDGFLPLHYAALIHPPIRVFKALLDVHKDGAKHWGGTVKLETDEELPLHCAARTQAPVEVIEVLLQACPGAAKETTKDGFLPIHLALLHRASLEVVKKLLAAYPEGVTAPYHARLGSMSLSEDIKDTSDQNLPLHFAVANQAPIEIVTTLLQANAQAAMKKNAFAKNKFRRIWDTSKLKVKQRGLGLGGVSHEMVGDLGENLPLHLAVKHASEEVVLALIDKYPDGASEADRKGCIPLHYAAANSKLSHAVLEGLLDAHLAGVKATARITFAQHFICGLDSHFCALASRYSMAGRE